MYIHFATLMYLSSPTLAKKLNAALLFWATIPRDKALKRNGPRSFTKGDFEDGKRNEYYPPGIPVG